jgi:membrane protease YdiL (CAAX protease family)
MVIAIAFLVGRAIGKHRLRDYGLTLARRSIGWHVRASALTLAFAFLPGALLLLARDLFEMPGGPPFWNVLDTQPWTMQFWMFILASSTVLPPIVEEIFFRGYAQARLATAFPSATAVTIVAGAFTLAHGQYLDGTLLGTLMVVCLFWEALVWGYARIATGSLLAPMIAHAVANLPMVASVRWALAVVLGSVVGWALLYSNLDDMSWAKNNRAPRTNG